MAFHQLAALASWSAVGLAQDHCILDNFCKDRPTGHVQQRSQVVAPIMQESAMLYWDWPLHQRIAGAFAIMLDKVLRSSRSMCSKAFTQASKPQPVLVQNAEQAVC